VVIRTSVVEDGERLEGSRRKSRRIASVMENRQVGGETID